MQSYYVIQKHDTIIESQYFKPIFKSKRFFIGIWRAITLDLKGSVYFLEKNEQINFEIYINQVQKKLELTFFKCCIEKKRDIIWIDDGAWYHISKKTTK